MELWQRYTRLQQYKRDKALQDFYMALGESLYLDKIVGWLASKI